MPGIRGAPFRIPQKAAKFHRWITKEDPTFEDCHFNQETGYACKTPEKYRGTRRKGDHPASSRVQFTLPSNDDEPHTIELLRSREQDNPSFGAVKVKLPIEAKVVSKDSRLVVEEVARGSNADNAMIRQGDIIRAVSLPDTEDTQGETPWWERLGQSPVPTAEKGMAILDGKPAGVYNAALRENVRVNGEQSQVVLLIERPVRASNDGDGRSVSRRDQLDQQVTLGLLPIPVLVEDNPGRMQSSLNSAELAQTSRGLISEANSGDAVNLPLAALTALLFAAGAVTFGRLHFRRSGAGASTVPLLTA
jgi:hypothetical protein